ncbi:MAG TPA: glycerol kinase, partial [Flavobacteriales bacterium]|nr:glycerol kinase [Flavobacteriales bacterium]
MTSSYILALDQGTTSSRSLIVDARGHVLFQAQKEFTQHYPKPGWVEHDPREIWSSQWATIQDVLAKVDSGTKAIAGIGITNQRETALVWDRLTGEPIYPAIVWQDRRTGDYCDALKSDSTIKDQIQSSTGLMVDAYFSASKIRWILNHVEGARERAETGELLFGTVDSWLVWKLSNGASHITDASNASRTMLFNIHTLQWDDSLCALFGIPMAMLPKVVDSSGQLAEAPCFDHPIPISG